MLFYVDLPSLKKEKSSDAASSEKIEKCVTSFKWVTDEWHKEEFK